MTRPDYNALADLLRVPSIDMAIARELLKIDITRVQDLIGRDPEALYDELVLRRGKPVDPFYLYVLRSAVYFAETPNPDPERVHWHAWQD
ncbi:MAG: helix-hairpin-helix domain-containing protein [Sumerlaeia bacterium]